MEEIFKLLEAALFNLKDLDNRTKDEPHDAMEFARSHGRLIAKLLNYAGFMLSRVKLPSRTSELTKLAVFADLNELRDQVREAVYAIQNRAVRHYVWDKAESFLTDIELASIDTFDVPTAYASASSEVARRIVADLEKRQFHSLPWGLFDEREEGPKGRYQHRSVSLSARMAKSTLLRQLHQRNHATDENMRALLSEENQQLFDRLSKDKGVAFFVGGTYGSGKSSSLDVVTSGVASSGSAFQAKYALSADPIKHASIVIGSIFRTKGLATGRMCLRYALATSHDKLHFEASGSEYDARKAILDLDNQTTDGSVIKNAGSFIYDGSLGYSGDVRQALDKGKSVVVKFSLVPVEQSLIRVLARSGNKNPKIPFDNVIRSYRNCLQSLKEMREMQEKYNEQMILEVYGPTFRYEHVSDTDPSLNYTYQDGPGKNVLISDKQVLNRLIKDYERQFEIVVEAAKTGKLVLTEPEQPEQSEESDADVREVFNPRFFSPGEWRALTRKIHLRQLAAKEDQTLKTIMDDYAKQKPDSVSLCQSTIFTLDELVTKPAQTLRDIVIRETVSKIKLA